MVGPEKIKAKRLCFLIRFLMIRCELSSVFGLFVIFYMNTFISWPWRHAFPSWHSSAVVAFYVKGRPDAFFWPRAPSVSIFLFRCPLCKMVCILSSTLLNGTRSTAAIQGTLFWRRQFAACLLKNVDFNLWSFSNWFKTFECSCWERRYCLDYLKES